MKKVILLVLVVFSFSSAYPQDLLIKEIKELTLENDSLLKVIKPLKDSITKLNSDLATANSKVRALESEKSNLNLKLKTLESSTIKVERDNLKAKFDSLTLTLKELKTVVSNKEKQVILEKERGEKKSIEEKERGKQEVINKIIQTYSKPFDELIKNSTLKTVEREIVIIGDKTEVQQRLLDLQKYFKSELALSVKCNEQNIKDAQDQLTNIEQTVLVLKLTDRLNNYKLSNDGLKTTIDEILKYDKETLATDVYSRNEKFSEISGKLAGYYRNYRFNFTDYPYLTEVVQEIMKRKQKDVNADITDQKNKL
jgi:hypothetical protein